MKILGIETSCDETAISIIKAEGDIKKPESLRFDVLADAVLSQIAIHKEYGGVFPSVAKREHAKALIPLFKQTLEKTGTLKFEENILDKNTEEQIRKILEREADLADQFLAFIPTISKPDIDAIAVTKGPGLEPALWVGINFAKALSIIWNIPIIPTNHMEGHIVSALTDKIFHSDGTPEPQKAPEVTFPAIALLISGGHTELVLIEDWTKYKVIGRTKDDAVGEAFDKVARMLGLPYPGGPEISKIASISRNSNKENLEFKLPRPMIHSGDYDFSFSGLKTAVLYTVKKLGEIEDETKQDLAREFEDAVVEVLISKTKKAQNEYGAGSIILGGGVSANKEIRHAFENWTKENNLNLFIPNAKLSTDNALMIAIAGYIEHESGGKEFSGMDFVADGNLSLEN